MLKPVRRILVIKLRDIGDIVLSTPVLRVLNDNCNAPEITYVLKKEYENFRHILPHIKRVITYDKKESFGFLRLILELRKYKFDLAVNLHASFRSALIALLSGAKVRLVHNHSGRDWFTSAPLNIKEGPKPNTERDLETLSPLDIKINPLLKKTKLDVKEETFSCLDFDGEKTVGFGIGAKRRQKIWPKDRFAELGRNLAAKGYKIAVMCIEKEKKDAESIAEIIGAPASVYVSNFLTFSYMISRINLFIGNDSALAHIAAATGTKSITLFGPENPGEWHPYREKDGHIAVSHLDNLRKEGVDVMSRKYREKSMEPIERITVQEVYEKALLLLAGK